MEQSETLRGWLEKAGFSFETGTLVLAEYVTGEDPRRDFAEITGAYLADASDPQLDIEFYPGYGGDVSPAFFARDGDRIFFMGEYDGFVSCKVMTVSADHYLGRDGWRNLPRG